MPCLVCHDHIAISGFQLVFSWKEPLLCQRCSPHLKMGSGSKVFVYNEWLQTVVDRLEKGDVALLEILRPAVGKKMSEPLKRKKAVVACHSKAPPIYPWLSMLAKSIQAKPIRPEEKSVTISLNDSETDFSIW